MAEFQRLLDLHGCKITVRTLLTAGAALETHLSAPTARIENVPTKTGEMETAEVACGKRVVSKKRDGGEGVSRKKRKTHIRTPLVNVDSEHVSSPIPINHTLPINVLVNKEHASETVSSARLAALRNQTDEQGSPSDLIDKNVEEPVAGEEGGNDYENVDVVVEGHGDNADRLSGLHTQPSPNNRSGPHIGYVEKPVGDKQLLDTEMSYSVGRFDGVPDGSTIKRSWKFICQSAQQQANVLLRFEALSKENADLVHAHESCKDVKARYKKFKKEFAKVRLVFDENVSAYDQLYQNYDGALTREKSLQERVEELEEENKEAKKLSVKQADRIKHLKEALKQSEEDAHQLRPDRERFAVECGNGEMSAEYKRSLGEVFSLAVGKGFINDLSVGRKDKDVQAILKATPSVDPTSSSTFMEEYNKLFDKRYPYVYKVARAYLLDPTGLQNIMPDETGPTPGQGPRDTPMTSYA
ncbi:V-type proton ATPase subunit B2 [Tanacetum coccineum]|uniref:V-type proton ATPase subunit B2 n=1 Tax=Tanacetum coccineum TaxID=301880 RepID=A0ABQ5ABP4_9ASTR